MGGAATAVETVSAAIMYDTTDFPVRTISIGDNLDILRGLNSVSVDLIYLDPPFNSNRNYAAPVGGGVGGGIRSASDCNELEPNLR